MILIHCYAVPAVRSFLASVVDERVSRWGKGIIPVTLSLEATPEVRALAPVEELVQSLGG